MSEKLEMPLISDLTGNEEEFITELKQCVTIGFVQLSVVVSDFLSKRLNLTVGVLCHRHTKQDLDGIMGESFATLISSSAHQPMLIDHFRVLTEHGCHTSLIYSSP
jgi:hypothetical protein